jgi:14-3-3 protein epsilon
MKGDYHRYLSEFQSGDGRKSSADEARVAYEAALVAIPPLVIV